MSGPGEMGNRERADLDALLWNVTRATNALTESVRNFEAMRAAYGKRGSSYGFALALHRNAENATDLLRKHICNGGEL